MINPRLLCLRLCLLASSSVRAAVIPYYRMDSLVLLANTVVLCEEQAAEHRFPAPADPYPLAASRAAMARERSSQPSAPNADSEPPDLAGAALRAQMYEFDPPPGAAVLRHLVISAALQSLRSSGDAGTP